MMKKKLRTPILWAGAVLSVAALVGCSPQATGKTSTQGLSDTLVVAEATAPLSFDPTQSDAITS